MKLDPELISSLGYAEFELQNCHTLMRAFMIPYISYYIETNIADNIANIEIARNSIIHLWLEEKYDH